MIEIFEFVLLRPLWLLALPLVVAISLYFMPRVTALAGWDRAIDPALLSALARLGRVVPGSGGRNWFPAMAALLIALALIGPASEEQEGASFRNLDGLVLVMDLSESVTRSERWEEALTAARQVVGQVGTRPVALVAYGGDAYLVSAFSSDHRVLGTTIAILNAETLPELGSRPERGLALARRSLSDADIIAGDVVLVTDGGGIDEEAHREARAIASLGSRVSTLFVPSGDGAKRPPADRSQIEALAKSGGGLVADVRDPASIAALGGESFAARLADGDFATLVWQDHGRLLLFLALIPALALFRRGA